MPKDNALLDVIKQIMDTITFCLIQNGDKSFIEKKYQQQMKNAIWSAVPNVGALFATSDPVALGLTLATQVGIGYMNYRRNKAEYNLKYEKTKWEINKNFMMHLNALQKQLFETAWHLADRYEFPDEYRLTEKQIEAYNAALFESNPIKRYNSLNSMRSIFCAYPPFWYQMGSTANNIYQNDKYSQDLEMQSMYRAYARECFLKYEKLNKFNLLRHDVTISSWALEYIELFDLHSNNHPEKAKELIEIAANNSGGQHDIIELCAFASLRIQDYSNATKYFAQLVNQDYNCAINAQILSGLYIQTILRDEEKAPEARLEYNQLKYILKDEEKKYIIPLPPEGTRIDTWKPEWNKEETYEEYVRNQTIKKAQEDNRLKEVKKKARLFYLKPITLVYKPSLSEIAEYMKGVIEENRDKIDSALPSVRLCGYKEYERNRVEIENNCGRIILIGESNIENKFVRNLNNNKYDFDKCGIKYVTNQNKSVIVASSPKNSELDKLILLAKDINKQHSVMIPDNVESISFSFMSDIFDNAFDDVDSFIATILGSIIGSPLLVVGQALEGLQNIFQFAQNSAAKKKIEFLQYCVGLYLFLESNNAIID